jgi:hypothetical protein
MTRRSCSTAHKPNKRGASLPQPSGESHEHQLRRSGVRFGKAGSTRFFRDYYGPTHKAFAALDLAGQTALAADITALLNRMNIGGANSLVVPAEYLEIVIVKV